ncbi:MAG: hypothetical protein LBP75_04245, partial [Planctomycetota bacterium]|nr:hypothetical protein [Planctomycetota bacterium]
KDGAKRQPQLDGSPRFGEPLSPPEAAFAAANRAAGLSDGCSATSLTQGGATVERVAYPGLTYFALSARLSEIIKFFLTDYQRGETYDYADALR